MTGDDWNMDYKDYAIAEKPFDYEAYIKERLKEISDLDDRKYAKKVLWEGLGDIFRHSEEKYEKLERRIYNEIAIPENRYQCGITIVPIKDYDPINGIWFPLDYSDIQEKKEIVRETVYWKLPDSRLQEIPTECSGVALVNGEERTCRFRIVKAVRYRHMIEELYQVFVYNNVRWTTINTAYLDRFYDVIPESLEDEQEESPDSYRINWGELSPFVEQNYMPLWNVEKFTFDCVDFMMPCMDGIHYEHEFDIEEYGREHGYLIGINEEIEEIRQEENKIILKSKEEIFENWIAYRICGNYGDSGGRELAMPLFNSRRDSFIRRYSYGRENFMMSRTELFRRVREFALEEYVELIQFEIVTGITSNAIHADMNVFVKEEIFPFEERRILKLVFREKQACYLNESFIRFLVSQIQLEQSEFKCVGVMI